MTHSQTTDWKTILVNVDGAVLDRQQQGDEPKLLRRARDVAHRTGAAVELFAVCHDDSLHQAFFAVDPGVRERQQSIIDAATARLAELSLAFREAGIEVHCEVVWDAPAAEALLQKIASSAPNVVFTRAQDHDYLIGISRNRDWDLIRQSPSHIWFVREDSRQVSCEGSGEIEQLLTAVGGGGESDQLITARDYEVFALAQSLAVTLGAANTAVHAWQVPRGVEAYLAYQPDIGALGGPAAKTISDVTEARRRRAQKEHGRAIRQFAAAFDIEVRDMELEAGHPAHVLPDVAEKVSADLLVMGARDLSRWERALSSVTAEPVLSRTASDVLVIREAPPQQPATAVQEPAHAVASVNVEAAIVDPARVFRKPAELAHFDAWSMALRLRLLEIWRQDVVAEQTAEAEAGMIGAPDADRLTELDTLIAELRAGCDDAGPVRLQRHSA